jgi:threonyl-tRNA synthetase
MGSELLWQKAEQALRDALNKSGKNWGLKEGDGAFYGPKIDIQIKDALGRAIQCGTI